MNLLAITRHTDFIDRLRLAFEGAGHRVQHLPDHLEVLARNALEEAQVIVADASGDPLDGFRLCQLLRGESRALFHGMPIYLVFEAPPEPEELQHLQECGADGHLITTDGLHHLLSVLGPAVEGGFRTEGPPVPLLIVGLRQPHLRKAQEALEHQGFALRSCTHAQAPEVQLHFGAPLLVVGMDRTGEEALAALRALQSQATKPYIILLGRPVEESMQRRLLLSGAMDWLHPPVSPFRLLHACRRGLETLHARRLQREFRHQLTDQRERRQVLEREAASLRSEVLTDPLTELFNRRAFNQNLENAFNQWERHRRSFVLVLGDLDYFKLVNDRFGHLVGDRVLQAIGQSLRHILRRSDLAFRIGGEEFAVLLSETGLQAGTEVAEKLRRHIDQQPITLDSGHKIFPTMSFGVGHPNGHTAESLYLATDRALYLSKNKGRNRVEVAEA